MLPPTRTTPSRRTLLGTAAALLAGAQHPASAQPAIPLYTAMAIVTGTDMRSRPGGFLTCLHEVLVKVAGEPRLLADPRLAAATAHPETLVTAFDYFDPIAGRRPHDDQGSYDRSYDLTVHFDPARVDALLATIGQSPWHADRPTIVPALLVRGLGTPHRLTYLLTAEAPEAAAQRASFANAAQKYGMPVRIPTAAEFADWNFNTDRPPSAPLPPRPGEAVVQGLLVFRPEALGWVGNWQASWNGTNHTWGVTGVGYDVAFDTLVRGMLRLASGHSTPE